MKKVEDEITAFEELDAPTQKTETPKYDAKKKYSWEVDSQFTMNGSDFGLILNALRTVVNTEEAAKIILADKACHALEKIMSTAVETGVIVEME